MSLRFYQAIILSALFQFGNSHAFDAIKIDHKNAMFTAEDHTVKVVTAKYIGWSADWQWANNAIKPDLDPALKKQSDSLKYKGNIQDLEITYTLAINSKDNQVTWDYHWDKKRDEPDAIGVGIEFALNPDAPGFNNNAKLPDILPDNQGWRWQSPDGNTLEVKFSPGLAKLHYDPKKKNKIRAFFFKDIRQGKAETTMTIGIIGTDAKFLPVKLAPNEEQVVDTKTWHTDILSELASPIDLSYLNKNDMPAGKHGLVKADGDKLVYADGTPAKFWGANVMAQALFKSKDEDIKAHAKRIAKLGFNLIRIHHHDSSWVKDNIFKNQEHDTQEFSPERLKKLDLWISSLEAEGVYIWLDLHVGRTFTAKDGIEGFNEIEKSKNGPIAKGFNYYNESIQQQMKAFNEAYLNHANAYTHRAYKDDPGIFAILITNENDLTQHYGNLLASADEKGFNKHSELFTNDKKAFSEHSGLSEKKAGRVWDMGEAKIYLSDVEHRFNQMMIAHLKQIGTKPLLATTNSWGKMGLFGLPSLTDGDLIDAHSYGGSDEFKFNPRYNPSFLAWLGAAQVTGKPLSVTEWNLGKFPILDRQNVPLFTASIASLQGWDAMMLYGYSQNKFGKLGKFTKASNWSAYSDPSIIGLMPAAALLYRQGHVAPAKNHYELKLSPQDFFYKKQDPTTSKTIRTLLETSRFTVTVPETKELPWLKPGKTASKPTAVVNDANKDFIPESQEFVQSDTGELRRDWQKGIHTINTPKSQVAAGGLGGETVKLQDVTFIMKTNATVVAVQSLDDKAIKESKSLFITALARSVPGQYNKLPYQSEPVSGDIDIAAPSGLKLFPINRNGEKGKAIKVDYSKGMYHLKLEERNNVHWLMLSAS